MYTKVYWHKRSGATLRPFFRNCRKSLSEEGVNEWGCSSTGKENQDPHQPQSDQDRKEPPLFVVCQETPKFTQKADLGILFCLFFEIGFHWWLLTFGFQYCLKYLLESILAGAIFQRLG
jgi:hypothetical protein